jgi:hypothetical protein
MEDLNRQVLQQVDSTTARIAAMTNDHAAAHQCISETLSIVEAVYGVASIQLKRLREALDHAQKINMRFGAAIFDTSQVLLGTLQAVRTDVEAGVLRKLIRVAVANVVLDFVVLAERALDDGRMDVAAVLSAAAFEDLMKTRGEEAGLEVDGKDLSEVINALKASGTLAGPQAKVVASYVPFRNKAMHAEWDKLLAPEVAGLIAFIKNAATAA